MKKLKTMICILVLSIGLVGNTFAGDSVNAGITGIFNNIVTTIMSVVGGSDDCPVRDCSNCKPGDNNTGNCRPTDK